MPIRRLALAALAALVAFAPRVAAAQPAPIRAVVYFDNESGEGFGLNFANRLYNLVGHFTTDIAVREVGAYQPGDMADFDFALYMGYEDRVLPDAFLADVSAGLARVMWVSGNFFQWTEYAGEHNAQGVWGGQLEDDALFDRVAYKGRRLRRAGDLARFQLSVDPGAQVLAELASSDSSAKTPYFACGPTLCYIADNPFPDDWRDARSIVFADLLHEFFYTGVTEHRRALVRLEDLAPGVSDLAALDEWTDELESRGTPFSMGVVPVFVDPNGKYYSAGTRYTYAEDDAFFDAVERGRARGGSIVMHGYTHQHDGGVSREDWEFVVDGSNVPLPADGANWARGRVESGLAQFAARGRRPRVWETPHYAASPGDYAVFGEYFDAIFESQLVFSALPGEAIFGEFLSPSTQFIPFELHVGSNGEAVVPENLGYFDFTSPEASVDEMLLRADELTVLRDAVASFYFHHDLVPPDAVREILDRLSELDYEFASLSDFVPGADDIEIDPVPLPDDDEDSAEDEDDEPASRCGC